MFVEGLFVSSSVSARMQSNFRVFGLSCQGASSEKEGIGKLLDYYIQQRKELSRAVSTNTMEIVKRDLDWEKYLKNLDLQGK